MPKQKYSYEYKKKELIEIPNLQLFCLAAPGYEFQILFHSFFFFY